MGVRPRVPAGSSERKNTWQALEQEFSQVNIGISWSFQKQVFESYHRAI